MEATNISDKVRRFNLMYIAHESLYRTYSQVLEHYGLNNGLREEWKEFEKSGKIGRTWGDGAMYGMFSTSTAALMLIQNALRLDMEYTEWVKSKKQIPDITT